MATYTQSSCTLSTITDVEAVYTYYYLSDSTITIDEAPKDNVNPPGASTITIISDGNSYTWQITEPELDIQNDVIQTAVGKLYYIECVQFSDGTYDWGPLMTSSTYAAAKAAYNLSSQALSQATAANNATALLGGHFIYNSTWQTTNTPHSANVVQTVSKNGIDVTQDPTKWDYNVHIGANGIRLRDNELVLSEWTSSALTFNNPSTGSAQLIIGANGTLQSGNYIRGSDSKFSNSGTKIDLTTGDIITKYFRLSQGSESNVNAGAYIYGTIEAIDGRIGGYNNGVATSNYWDIGNYTDYLNQPSAKMIGHGSSFIQLGDSSTWRLATNRIHTGWYESGDSYLHFPIFTNGIANRRWDYGIHVPTSKDDKFIYIRNASATTDLNNLISDLEDTQTPKVWEYQFWIDGSGNIHAPGFYIGNSTTPIGGGVGTVAERLTRGYGGPTQPIYFNDDGIPTKTTYTLNAAGAKGVDTSITTASTSTNLPTSEAVAAFVEGKGYITSYTETDPTVPSWAKSTTKPSYTATEVGAIPSSQKGAANGVVPLNASSKIDSTYLPSYVDDVLEYNSQSSFPSTGESGKIYIDASTNKTYRWSGSTYIEISSSLALGETDSTAYRGDRGKVAYDHANAKGSAFTSGLYKITTNSEGHVTAATAAGKGDIGLGNVDNKSSATIRGEITSANITSALGFTPYDNTNPDGYITSADVSDTKVNVSTRGSTKAYILATTSSPTSTKTAREAVAETGVYLETSNSATRLVAPTFVGDLTGTASGNLTSNSNLAWAKITGADDLKAIENLTGTAGLLRKTASNTWSLDTNTYLTSYTETDPVFSASAASGITSNDITNWNGKTSNTGTVTSVRVQATSPVQSSVSTAQSVTLNTTISLADAYGDLKNPYASKTARYVLAAPANAAGAPSFRALTGADVGLGNVTNYSQITKIGDSGDGKLRVWTGNPDGTNYTDVTVHITAYDQSTVAKAEALDLAAAVGSTKKPVYFKADGKPYAIDYTIETSVPSGALFTDTTYTFANGINGFTVTPKEGTAQTVTVTPSITDNVTGSGTSGKLVKWNGTNKITDGPTFTSGGTGYLKEDGTWGTPGGTYSLPTATYNVLGGLKPWYSTTGASTLASGSAGSNTSTPSINARTTTAGKYYAVEIDKNGRLFVNVPWTNTNGSYLTSAVTTLTTQAGGHTVVTSVSGDVTINIPTKTSHLTNDSGYITGYTDEKMKWTASTSSNTYYPLVSTSTATTSTANTLNSITFYQYYNTAGGYRQLILGNTTAYTSTGGAYGTIRLYGTGATYYGDLNPGTIGSNSLTANRTWTLPNASGTIALTSNIPDVSSFITDAGVTKITTTAGAHTAITDATGAVSFNVPTKVSHLNNDSGFVTSSGVTSITLTQGTGISITNSGTAITTSGTRTISLATVTRTNNTSTASPTYSGTFTAIDSITTDSYGRVTAVNTKTITLPAVGADTKNTAGATDTSSEIYLIGATSQATNPQTYSHDTARVRANGNFVGSGYEMAISSAMGTTKARMDYNSTLDAIVFSFV